jgi:antitoxin component HigA of HigAB toxin-antitoxin module
LGEGKTLPPFYLDKHKRLLKLLREFRDDEEGYEVVLAEFEKFLNLEEESLKYRAMAFDVMRTSARAEERIKYKQELGGAIL